jgi:hypothetical protein
MNRTTSFASITAAIALSFAAAGPALADDITIDPVDHQSLKTRAEVRAELAQFQQQRVNPWSTSYNVLTGFKSQLTRAEVLAQVNAARASGELAALASEDSGSAYFAQHQQPASSGSTLVAARPATR